MQVKSLRKRFRETAFARGVHRDSIERCAELGLELDDFLGLALAAMQGIAATGSWDSAMPTRRAGATREGGEPSTSTGAGRFLDQRHPGQAALLLEQALTLEPDRTPIREALARAYYALGRYADAAEVFDEIVRRAPTNDYAHFGLARSCWRWARRRRPAARLARSR